MSFAAHLVPLFSDRLRPVSQRAQSDSRTRPREQDAAAAQNAEIAHEQRQRGVIGYHNPFKDPSVADETQESTPPAYNTSRQRGLQRRYSLDDAPNYDATAPDYDCSVFCEGRIDLKIERKTPFSHIEEPKWESVYAVLQGTVLNFHALKSSNPLAMAANPALADRRAGKLIRSYTLQHAEAGLAADYKKYELVPRSQLTYLLSASAIRQLQLSEPSKFERVYQYVIRLRLEAHQVLLRFKSSAERTLWLNKIVAGIDIAPPLETRNEPKYITLPRRRRRRPSPNEPIAVDALREQQARIIREHYPQLAEAHDEQGEADNVQDFDDGRPAEPGAVEGAEREVEHEDEPQVPPHLAGVNANSAAQITGLMSQVNRILEAHTSQAPPRIRVHVRPNPTAEEGNTRERTDFDDDGKWAPYIPIDVAQESRIRRRCMPSLLFNSKRASEIIIVQGRRVKIDYDSQSLKPWSALPPTYDEAQDDNLSPTESHEAPSLPQSRHDVALLSTPRQSSRNLLLRVRTAPDRAGQDPSGGHNATATTADDVTSSDGSSHITPAPKTLFSRTANKFRRMTSRQQDLPTQNPKRNSGVSSHAATEQDATVDLRKLHSHMTGMASTASLAAAVGDRRAGF